MILAGLPRSASAKTGGHIGEAAADQEDAIIPFILGGNKRQSAGAAVALV